MYQKPDLFHKAGITHIVSVLDFDIYEAGAFKQYQHLMIRVDDDPNENLLQHFGQTNDFIDEALRGGGGVFVHCAMGKSRSATIVCAYLMRTYKLDPKAALEQVCEGRPVCSPNPGFMEQLAVFYNMLQADDEVAAGKVYAAWVKGRWTGDWWTWEKRAAKASAKL